MSFDKNWQRWIRASIQKTLSSVDRNDPRIMNTPVPLSFEGENLVANAVARLELRIDGPKIMSLQKNLYLVECAVDIYVWALLSDADLYLYDRLIGLATSMHQDIQVYRYGPDNPPDDSSFVFCLPLSDKLSEPVDVRNFGRIDQKTRALHGSVTGFYRGHIET